MNWGIYLLGALTLIVLAGTLPVPGYDGFPTHMFASPLFTALCILLAFLPLGVLIVNRVWRKNIWLWTTHFALTLIVLGAWVRSNQRVESFQFPVNVNLPGSYIASVPVPSNTPESRYDYLPLGFTLGCDTFQVERYQPDFDLFRRTSAEDGHFLQTFSPDKNGLLSFEPYDSRLLDSRIWGKGGQFEVSEELIALERRKDKDYRAVLLLGTDLPPNGSDSFILRPNHPLDRNGWRLYLMDYGDRNGASVIQLMAVRDPGRKWVLPGLWLLIAGAAGICIQRFRREV